MIIFLFINVPTRKFRIIIILPTDRPEIILQLPVKQIMKMLLPNKRKINFGIKWNNNPDKEGSTVNKTAAFKEIFYVSWKFLKYKLFSWLSWLYDVSISGTADALSVQKMSKDRKG